MGPFEDADHTYTNEGDGQTFYGYDDGDGHTDWYDSDGNLDSSTPEYHGDEYEW